MRVMVAGSLFTLLLSAGVVHSADSISADIAAPAASGDAVVANDTAEEAANQAWQAYRTRIVEDLARE